MLAHLHPPTEPDNGLQLVEPKKLTLAQLKEYDGSDKKRPIYLAIRGIIFDVSKGELSMNSSAHPAKCMHICGWDNAQAQRKATQQSHERQCELEP